MSCPFIISGAPSSYTHHLQTCSAHLCHWYYTSAWVGPTIMTSVPTSSAICRPARLGKDLLKDKDFTPVAPNYMDLVYSATEHVYTETKGRIVPTTNQLLYLVALQKKDVLYIAATGSGKTLIIAMFLLVNPNAVAITIIRKLFCTPTSSWAIWAIWAQTTVPSTEQPELGCSSCSGCSDCSDRLSPQVLRLLRLLWSLWFLDTRVNYCSNENSLL